MSRPLPVRKCDRCGAVYKPKRSVSRLCSTVCRNDMLKYRRRRPIADRFWEKVAVGEPDKCWLWTGCLTGNNKYGAIGSGVGSRCFRAHRVSWEIHFGPIPNGLRVLHKCDVPACVNPSHLWLGTLSDNALDRERKGRGRDRKKSLRNETHC